ncbi:DNA-processing protein DprA [Ignatzschineria sp. LJL83]
MLDAWLTLYYTPLIGAVRFKCLIDYFGSAEKAVIADDLEWQNAGIPSSVIAKRASYANKVEQALLWAEKPNHHILTFHHEHYPSLLKEIFDPPMLLFVQGNLEILGEPQIAIVGARKPTSEGLYNARLFAEELAKAGLITSGLAIGVDKVAHEATVAQQKPTIAVLGSGLNEVYPKSHLSLSREILQNNGTLISEYPLQMPPKPQNFPRRNRIIAGLSLGTLVVEATLKSGSLITARLSMEENREVFTIPGSIHQPQSRGCHQLIREGATLVESTLDIRTHLKGWFETSDPIIQSDLFMAQEDAQKASLTISSKNSLKRSSDSSHTQSTPKIATTKIKPEAIPPITLPEDHPQYALFQLLEMPKSINQLVELTLKNTADITADLIMLEIEGVIISEQGFYRQIRSM